MMTSNTVLECLVLLCAVALVVTRSTQPRFDDSQKYIFVQKQQAGSNKEEVLEAFETPSIANVNNFMDEIFVQVRKQMQEKGLGEVALPKRVLELRENFLGIPLEFKVGLDNGFLRGLDTIKRAGNSTLHVDGTNIVINMLVGIYNTELGFDLTAEAMKIGPHVQVSGSLSSATARVKIVVNLAEKKVVLESLEVADVGDVKVEVSGLLRIFDWIIELVSDFVAKFVKGFVATFMEGPIKDLAQSIINKFPIDHLIPGF